MTILEIYVLSQGVIGDHARLFKIGVAVTMTVGWLVTSVMWGHCHLDVYKKPGQGWPKSRKIVSTQGGTNLLMTEPVCYQYNLQFEDHGYIPNVNHQLGDAVVAMGAIMMVM